MTRPNKVFLLTSENNFLPNIPFSTLEQALDVFIKSLCTGYGPFPIASVTVVDKVATVDIGEVVKIYPGQKISISGTGVTDLDTWHEVDTIRAPTPNVFTFNIDVPDGTYTNGITLSYPSLGWTLVDRNSNTLLLKSGNSGTVQHVVSLTFSVYSGSTHVVTIKRYSGILPTTVTELAFNTNFQPPAWENSCILQLSTTLTNVWYFYGDDAFAVISLGMPYDQNYRNYGMNLDTMIFGEIKRTTYSVGQFIINANTDRTYYQYSTYPYCFCGITAGGSWHIVQCQTLISFNQDKTFYTSNFRPFPHPYVRGSGVEHYSGTNINTNYTKRYINSNNYSQIGIYDNSTTLLGFVPGLYWLSFSMPYVPVFTNYSMFFKTQPLGKLKDRKVYGRINTHSNNTSSITNFTSGSYNVTEILNSPFTCLFDLTGPIR